MAEDTPVQYFIENEDTSQLRQRVTKMALLFARSELCGECVFLIQAAQNLSERAAREDWKVNESLMLFEQRTGSLRCAGQKPNELSDGCSVSKLKCMHYLGPAALANLWTD